MDSYRITNSVAGTTVEIGTWIRGGEAPDFDDSRMYDAVYAQNALAEGAQLAFLKNGPRTFRFPLRVATGPMSLDLAEQILTRLIRMPQGKSYIDVQPELVPTGNQVRFDILNGRVKRKYLIYHQRYSRRELDLELDVQPFGYQPTYMLLASTLPSSPFLFLQWNPASILGDAPPNWEINFGATGVPTQYTTIWNPEGIVYSLSRSPSALSGPQIPFVNGPSMSMATAYTGMGSLVGTVASDGYAPVGGQFLRVGVPSFYWGTWVNLTLYDNANAHWWAGPGRYRMFAYARMSASAMPLQLAGDVADWNAKNYGPLASGYPVATLLAQGIVAGPPSSVSPSGAYQILDLGEFAVPVAGSQVPSQVQQSNFVFRLWGYVGTTTPGLATIPNVEVAGVYGLPVDGDYGLLIGGLGAPSYSNAAVFNNAVQIRSDSRTVAIANMQGAGSVYDFVTPMIDGRSLYYGTFPNGATAGVLEAFQFSRSQTAGATHSIGHANKYAIGASVRYQPRFAFVRSL